MGYAMMRLIDLVQGEYVFWSRIFYRTESIEFSVYGFLLIPVALNEMSLLWHAKAGTTSQDSCAPFSSSPGK